MGIRVIPLTIKGFTLMVNFWHHLTELPESSLARLALRESIEVRTNWIKTVEKVINIFDLAECAGKTVSNFSLGK